MTQLYHSWTSIKGLYLLLQRYQLIRVHSTLSGPSIKFVFVCLTWSTRRSQETRNGMLAGACGEGGGGGEYRRNESREGGDGRQRGRVSSEWGDRDGG